MAKVLYSLMLDSDVINEIDRIAHREGLTRSAAVNRILAEYASVTTPEKRINDIFSYIDSVFGSAGDIIPSLIPNQSTMSLKSCLDYKYRPTVRYEVELKKIPSGSIGTLSVIFRTQSPELLSRIVSFFRLWKGFEDKYLDFKGLTPADYSLSDGRLVRTIVIENSRNMSPSDVGDAISSYINVFDNIMKSYIVGNVSALDAEKIYLECFKHGDLII